LHVLIPLGEQLTHEQSRTLGELIARIVVTRHPDIATIARSLRSRKNKVYVDYLQNGHGRLIVAPFSVRAEPAASVSMPISWREVNSGLTNSRFHIGNAPRRMQRLKQDPLLQVLTQPPDLVRSLRKLAELLA
jgi:bifunctional non-homologous end joining protein LigD